MTNSKDVKHTIVKIIGHKLDATKLEEHLIDANMDWDEVVKVASAHLVLPTIYCKLKEKKLLHVLPNELSEYLNQITTINRNRNLTIIEEVNSLSKQFNIHEIDHVFLKGSAMVAAGMYKDLGERMIGDIDILVAEEHLEKAQDLLVSNGYEGLKQTFGNEFVDHYHLPRFMSPVKLAAVELHKRLLKKPKYLNSKQILNHKEDTNSIFIPSISDMYYHNIFNYQINDAGNYYLKFNLKSYYDTILLSQRWTPIKNKMSKLISYRNYFNICEYYDRDQRLIDKGFQDNCVSFIYKLKVQSQVFNFIFTKLFALLATFKLFFNRLILAITNKMYRKALFKDRSRILRLIWKKM